MSRNVALANEEIAVRSARLTKLNVIRLNAGRLIHGTDVGPRSRCAKTRGSAFSLAMMLSNRAAPNIVALIADAVDRRAPKPMRTNPAASKMVQRPRLAHIPYTLQSEHFRRCRGMMKQGSCVVVPCMQDFEYISSNHFFLIGCNHQNGKI